MKSLAIKGSVFAKNFIRVNPLLRIQSLIMSRHTTFTMKFCTFVFLSIFAYSQMQVNAVPVTEEVNKTSSAPVEEANVANKEAVNKQTGITTDEALQETDDIADNETDTADKEDDFENESHSFEQKTTSNKSHLFNLNSEGANGSASATPNLDAFMRAFKAIDQKVYNQIETFLENIVPKLPENNNPITNHLESAVFLFELYEKMKEPRDLNNSQEQNFLAEIENFLASNSFLLFNKPTSGRQEQYDEDFPAEEGDEENQEFETNDNIQDNNLDELTNKHEKTDKPHENNAKTAVAA